MGKIESGFSGIRSQKPQRRGRSKITIIRDPEIAAQIIAEGWGRRAALEGKPVDQSRADDAARNAFGDGIYARRIRSAITRSLKD